VTPAPPTRRRNLPPTRNVFIRRAIRIVTRSPGQRKGDPMEETPRGTGRHEVAPCPKCGKPIWSDHPYSWCSKCGMPLPADVQGRLATLQGVKKAAADSRAAAEEGRTTTLVVDGRAVPCPICGHDRYWTRETVMSDRGLALFDAEWAGASAMNYVCDRCGHVLWFMPK